MVLADVFLDDGRWQEARSLIREALTFGQGRAEQAPLQAAVVARLLHAEGRFECTAILLGSLYESRSRRQRSPAAWSGAMLEDCRSRLGEDALEAALARGRELSLNEAVQRGSWAAGLTESEGAGAEGRPEVGQQGSV